MAHPVQEGQEPDAIYSLGEAGVVDGFFHLLEQVGIPSPIEEMEVPDIQRVLIPVMQPVLLYMLGIFCGNVSGRDFESQLVVIKLSGVPYEELTPRDLVVVNLDGQVVEGDLQPSVDTATHLYIYRHRPNVGGCGTTYDLSIGPPQPELPFKIYLPFIVKGYSPRGGSKQFRVATPTPTVTPVPTATPTATPTPTATRIPTVTPTPSPTTTPTPTEMPTPTATETPIVTPSPTGEPSPTATPTGTLVPTATP